MRNFISALTARHRAHWVGMAAVAVVASGVVWALFPSVLAHPDDIFFLNAGDGLQGYYTMAYYVKYDTGLHFSGMNYPFGEHINFPSMQPLVSGGMRLLGGLGLPVGDHVIGLTNVVALLGLVLAPVVMYAVLRRTRLPVWYAAITAVLIGFMSPQIERLGGHMALSYACFVPFSWYCLIRIQEAPLRARWYLVFGLSSLLMAGASVYFLPCASFLALAHGVVFCWQRRRPGPILWRLALAALLPLLVFRGWLWYTDPIADRPINPYGFLVYLASPATIFTPVMAPFSDLWQALFHTEAANFEGWAYVGLAAAAVAVAGALRLGKRVWHRQWGRVLRPVLPVHLQSGLWAAGFMLLLAFGWPFKFAGFSWLVDYVGPLKQFRALGRFAWPFFYVFSTYAAYYLYRLWRYLHLHGAGGFAQGWLALPLLLWGIEAYIHVSTRAKAVEAGAGAAAFMDAANNPVVQQLSWTNRQARDFQAILPLPYFVMGSDKADLSGSQASFAEGYKTSLALGLPLVATYMTRTSVGQTMQHVQLLSSPLVEKELLAKLPSRKPFLLLVTPDALTWEEQRLVSLGRKLVSLPNVTLYELPIDALAATTLAQERARAQELLPTLTANKGLYSSTGKGVLLDAFKGRPDPRGRLSSGSFHEPAATFSTLYDGPLPAPADTGRYEAAVWVNTTTDYGFGNMQVKLYTAAGQILAHEIADGRRATEVQGDWVRIVVPFRRTAEAVRLEVLYDSQDLVADDLLIRPVDTDVYYYVGQGSKRQLVKNTYPLTP